jgi:iron(III) transport system substrate-binding protein
MSMAVQGAEVPAATMQVLAKLKLQPAILKGLDKELAIPKAWIAGARKEAGVKILGTWDAEQFTRMTGAFRERYRFIKLNYTRAGQADRTIKTIMALKAGRVIADVLVSIGNTTFTFKKMGALADLRELPGYANLPKGFADADGRWVGAKITFRCIAYNTKRVKKADLPRVWDDLLTNPRWRGRKLGIPNRPNNWMLNLWGKNGPKWAQSFMTQLFTKLDPQLRKEGLNASLGLAVAGEFDAVIPASSNRAQQYLARGAPVGWHCPSPVPMSITQMVMLRKAPRPNGAKIFINWFLSREAQMAQFEASYAVPVHKDLQTKTFRAFPEETIGKPVAFRHPRLLLEENQKLLTIWNHLWEKGTGISFTTVKATLLKVRRGGRKVSFKFGKTTHSVRLSGRRTQVYVNGERNLRKALKKGMVWEITYPGNKGEARSFKC